MGFPYAYTVHTDHALELKNSSMLQTLARNPELRTEAMWQSWVDSSFKPSFQLLEIGLGFGCHGLVEVQATTLLSYISHCRSCT